MESTVEPTVHYSVSFGPKGTGEQLLRQLEVSLASLRVRNPDTPVFVFCHGDVPDSLAALSIRSGATVVPCPPPETTLTRLIGGLGPLLASCPTTHKFTNFRALAELSVGPSIFLDCDTVVLGSLKELQIRHNAADVAAREEVGSAACKYADSVYLDERKLAAIDEHRKPLPAFNTGVVIFNKFPRRQAAEFERKMAFTAARFMVWMALHPPTSSDPAEADIIDLNPLRERLGQVGGQRLADLALPYPSANRWLLDEAALWVALGQEEATLEYLDPAWSAQGSECNSGPLPRTVWHYFSSNTEGMEKRLGLDRVEKRKAAGDPANYARTKPMQTKGY